jgi:hypothetical protein
MIDLSRYASDPADDQLENRFELFPLPRWQPDAEACSLLRLLVGTPAPDSHQDVSGVLIPCQYDTGVPVP